MRYADILVNILYEEGYRTCFYVGGGNIMHLVDAVHKKMTCIPCLHEVACGIAAEYYTEASDYKAFALVTAGPGLTNIVTAMAGAYLESRSLLVIGGQVKSSDLSHGWIRQQGIQEIDGVALVHSITHRSSRMMQPWRRDQVQAFLGQDLRKGPLFLEICLDVQGADVHDEPRKLYGDTQPPKASELLIMEVASSFKEARSPLVLLGAGIHRHTDLQTRLESLGIPTMTTWNAADRIDSKSPIYFGRPNTWGQRYSNILLQQADFILAIGTRLGLQQTGFAVESFAPSAKIAQIDWDSQELSKKFPRVTWPIMAEANTFMKDFLDSLEGKSSFPYLSFWRDHCTNVRQKLPLQEPGNITKSGFVDPYRLAQALSDYTQEDDIVIPCSSGGAFTTMMQTFEQKKGQIIITNKGLASMGYGLSGAIGASFAYPHRRCFLIEGDGGFVQNMQELGVVAHYKLPLKIFLFSNNGYASIRMTQKNYFSGRYYGCDAKTGLKLPDWERLFSAYLLPVHKLSPDFEKDPLFLKKLKNAEPCVFIVPIDPEQTYFPKISSRILPSGGMSSSPLDEMTPPLSLELWNETRFKPPH